MSLNRARQIVFIITLLSLALGFSHLYAIRNAPQFNVPVIDEAAYDSQAVGILKGTWPVGKVFYQDPLYPYFLAFVYRFVGHHIKAVKILQVFIGAMMIPLIFGIGRKAFGITTGVVAAILVALYKPLYFFEGVLDKEIFCLVLLSASLFTLLREEDDKRLYKWAIPGIFLGLACLTRANLLLMIPVWGAWIIYTICRRDGYKRGFAAGAIFGIAAVAAISPVTIHNIRAGDFVLITSQGGQNFFIGNHRRNFTGTYQAPSFVTPNPMYEESDFRREAVRQTGREMKPSETSKFYYWAAWEQIKEAPKTFLWRLWLKTELMVNNFEISDNINYYFFRERYSWVLRLPTPGWGFMAALAIWGGLALLARKGHGGGSPETGGAAVLLLAMVYSATLVAFYIFSRYRLPVSSAFALLAAFGLKTLWELAARRRRVHLIGALAVIIGLNVWTHKKIMEPHFDVAHYQTGNCLLQLARYAEAEKEFREAIMLEPNVPAYYNNLAGTLVKLGRNQEAIEAYDDAIAVEPRSPTAHIGLGNLYFEQKMYEDAAMHYQVALLFGGDSSFLWTQLGKAYMNIGRTVNAAGCFKKALDLDPKNVEARKLMEQIGQPKER